MVNKDFINNMKEDKSLKVDTTASTFTCTKVGELCKALNYLLLPKKGYYYRNGGVPNLLPLESVSKTHLVYMDTEVDNAFYVYNMDVSYISVRFGLCESTNH